MTGRGQGVYQPPHELIGVEQREFTGGFYHDHFQQKPRVWAHLNLRMPPAVFLIV